MHLAFPYCDCGEPFYRLAATQMQWAFVAPIVATVERIRMMFEKKSEIRRMAREEDIAKAEERGLERGPARGRARGNGAVQIGPAQARHTTDRGAGKRTCSTVTELEPSFPRRRVST